VFTHKKSAKELIFVVIAGLKTPVTPIIGEVIATYYLTFTKAGRGLAENCAFRTQATYLAPNRLIFVRMAVVVGRVSAV